MVWITLYKAKSPKMRRPLIHKNEYREVSRKLNWAFKSDYILWFTGEFKRHHCSNGTLKEMEDDADVVVRWYNGFKVYAHPSLCKGKNWNIEHGLGVTACIVRLWRSDTSGEIVKARRFKGAKVVPDAVIRYGEKTLFIEFGTRDNSDRWGVYTSKISRYRHAFPQTTILFVLDTERERVLEYVKSQQYLGGQFCFTDFETFKKVPIGKALTAPIYIWEDGEVSSLR